MRFWIYLPTVLGTSTLTLGIIEGIAEATAAITRIFSSRTGPYGRSALDRARPPGDSVPALSVRSTR
jgi:hypothetical protein